MAGQARKAIFLADLQKSIGQEDRSAHLIDVENVHRDLCPRLKAEAEACMSRPPHRIAQATGMLVRLIKVDKIGMLVVNGAIKALQLKNVVGWFDRCLSVKDLVHFFGVLDALDPIFL